LITRGDEAAMLAADACCAGVPPSRNTPTTRDWPSCVWTQNAANVCGRVCRAARRRAAVTTVVVGE